MLCSGSFWQVLEGGFLHRAMKSVLEAIWEFPKIRGTLLGVPILRIIVDWGLYWGTLILGNYHFPGG